MAVSKGLLGDSFIVEDKAIAVSIDRYNELIVKEALFDKLCEHSDIMVLLNMRINKEDK